MKKEGRKGGGGVMKEDGEGIREKVRGIGREEDNKVNLHFSGLRKKWRMENWRTALGSRFAGL